MSKSLLEVLFDLLISALRKLSLKIGYGALILVSLFQIVGCASGPKDLDASRSYPVGSAPWEVSPADDTPEPLRGITHAQKVFIAEALAKAIKEGYKLGYEEGFDKAERLRLIREAEGYIEANELYSECSKEISQTKSFSTPERERECWAAHKMVNEGEAWMKEHGFDKSETNVKPASAEGAK